MSTWISKVKVIHWPWSKSLRFNIFKFFSSGTSDFTYPQHLCERYRTNSPLVFTLCFYIVGVNRAPSSQFVSSSIPSWQILTEHAQSFKGVRDLAFCLKVPLDSLLVWASSEGSGETARMRRLAWTFAARIGDKYQIRLTRSNYFGSFGVNLVQ